MSILFEKALIPLCATIVIGIVLVNPKKLGRSARFWMLLITLMIAILASWIIRSS
jgi:hypothetical protein